MCIYCIRRPQRIDLAIGTYLHVCGVFFFLFSGSRPKRSRKSLAKEIVKLKTLIKKTRCELLIQSGASASSSVRPPAAQSAGVDSGVASSHVASIAGSYQEASVLEGTLPLLTEEEAQYIENISDEDARSVVRSLYHTSASCSIASGDIRQCHRRSDTDSLQAGSGSLALLQPPTPHDLQQLTPLLALPAPHGVPQNLGDQQQLPAPYDCVQNYTAGSQHAQTDAPAGSQLHVQTPAHMGPRGAAVSQPVAGSQQAKPRRRQPTPEH